jgi:phytoene dehydrogenase-like protein
MADAATGLGRDPRFDVVVVGAGHNGLVVAAYLARAGPRTAVVERRELVGGACTTEEFAPGFRASPGAYVLSLLRPAIWRDFSLRARGLEVLEAAPTLNVFRDGAMLTLHDDDRDTARELARFDRRDAAAYPRFRAELVAIADLLGPWFDRPAPGAPGWLARDSVRAIGRSLGPARRHGLAAAKLFATSARDHSSSGSTQSAPPPRSAGMPSPTRWRVPRLPGPRTRCCTSTPRPRSGAPPGGSSAAAWGG